MMHAGDGYHGVRSELRMLIILWKWYGRGPSFFFFFPFVLYNYFMINYRSRRRFSGFWYLFSQLHNLQIVKWMAYICYTCQSSLWKEKRKTPLFIYSCYVSLSFETIIIKTILGVLIRILIMWTRVFINAVMRVPS